MFFFINTGYKYLITEIGPSSQCALEETSASASAMNCEIQLVAWSMSTEGCILLTDYNKLDY